MSRRSAFTLCIVAAGLFGGLSAAHADIIGETASAKNEVMGAIGSQRGPLIVGASISGDERVTTGIASAALLRFRDNTQVNVGASSTVVLDRFLYNPDGSAEDAVINLTKGAMRFVTGNSPPQNFLIRTPLATIGIRGTDFVVMCDGATKCVVMVTKGHVRICPHSDAVCTNGYTIDETNNFTVLERGGINFGPQSVSQDVVQATNDAVANGRFVDIAGLGDLPPNVPGQPPTRFAYNGPPGFISPPAIFAASLGLTMGIEVGVIEPDTNESPASP